MTAYVSEPGEITCRGSFMLGTGCKICGKCEWERKQLYEKPMAGPAPIAGAINATSIGAFTISPIPIKASSSENAKFQVEIEDLEERCLRLCDQFVRQTNQTYNQQDLAQARTSITQGFMWLQKTRRNQRRSIKVLP